jgi:Nucleotidyl transferase AbiEii toxin, Type IV TA system
LSKAFGAIRRLSEGIDLSFDRADLGYSGARDPEKDGISKKQAAKLIEDLVDDVEKHIAGKLLPALHAVIVQHLGEPADGGWSLGIDARDRQTVNFHYPTALLQAKYEGMAYITPRVKLELGARGDPWPTETKIIRPYAADDYPSFFENPACTVTVLSARRTFWGSRNRFDTPCSASAVGPPIVGRRSRSCSRSQGRPACRRWRASPGAGIRSRPHGPTCA